MADFFNQFFDLQLLVLAHGDRDLVLLQEVLLVLLDVLLDLLEHRFLFLHEDAVTRDLLLELLVTLFHGSYLELFLVDLVLHFIRLVPEDVLVPTFDVLDLFLVDSL